MALPLQTRLDDVGGGVLYIGQAEPGRTTADSSWRIRKLTEIGSLLDVQYASGSDAFTHTWDDRATYTFS